MIAAIIPAYNEGENIQDVLKILSSLPIDIVVPVLNGCTDDTKAIIEQFPLKTKMAMVQYPLPMGVDAPRAIGARCAYDMGARAMLFIDGDMKGNMRGCLYQLIKSVMQEHIDMALTNCYPYVGYRSSLAKEVVKYREQLNRTLGVFSYLGLATPSHGPHCVSRRLVQVVGYQNFSVPPMILAKAVEHKLRVKVAASLENHQWSSQQRGDVHNEKIAETIIGDCIQARQYYLKQTIDRMDNGKQYVGYGRMQW